MCLVSGYIEPKEEKKMSLLKRKTNFDNLKELSAWDFAGKIDEFVQGDCDICPFSTMKGDVQECRLIDYQPTTCRRKYQRVNADEWDYDCTCNNIRPLTHPPQLWGYVEEV